MSDTVSSLKKLREYLKNFKPTNILEVMQVNVVTIDGNTTNRTTAMRESSVKDDVGVSERSFSLEEREKMRAGICTCAKE